jgi:hypothetical protein
VAGRGERFVPNQIVITGPPGAIDNIVGNVRNTFPGLSQYPIQEIDLGTLRELLDTERDRQPSADSGEEPGTECGLIADKLAGMVTRVYRLPEGVQVDQAIEEFYGQAPSSDGVYAEPNYIIGNPDIGGLSGCIEGGPAGAGGPGTGKTKFWDQWAFQQVGIGLLPRKGPFLGKGTRVVLFDTSPFDKPGRWHIKWHDTKGVHPLRICVSHPQPLAGEELADLNEDYRDHGLFGASLVHAVAPQSEIHLIRVLNRDNRGDLGTLVKALCDYMLQNRKAGKINLENTVLNLSLGLNGYVDAKHPRLRQVADHLRTADATLRFIRDSTEDDEIPVVYLQIVLGIACLAGAVIVAAAGNQSDQNQVKEMMIPASYQSVIGVAGHNYDQARSSFSNKGQIAAPGGDLPPDPDDNIINPNDWLIGLSMKSEPDQGYMYWMGTSFAAPLVAGEAALDLGKGNSPGHVKNAIKTHVTPANPPGNPHLGAGCAKVH